MRMLLVEDDPAILELLSTLFRRVGFEFDTAADGAIALRKLRRYEYSVVLLDLMLPVVNGFEVIRELRAFAPAMLDRTIVLTAASETTLSGFDRTQVFELIRKPFDVEHLMSAVARCSSGTTDNVPAAAQTYSLRIYP